jgi:crotonobetainyl-CoA:carnitine CoA-transferase CaiB-like acyl-CoA transferase
MTDMALSDVRVLDLTHHLAGPFCTKLLADYGADVVKVERPGTGDPTRSSGPFLGDDPHPEKSGTFFYLNMNKRGIVLDLKSSEGRDAVKELVRDVDIVVESFRPHVMPGLGLSYEVLRKINPLLVMTSISSFGQTGPYAEYKANELVAYGMGGAMYNTGLADREPLGYGVPTAVYQAGAVAAAGTMGAFFGARYKGVGQHVDVSVIECLLGSVDRRIRELLAYQYSGEMGGRESLSGGYANGYFPCQDGFFVMAANGPIMFPRLVEMMGNPPELTANRFITPEGMRDSTLRDTFETAVLSWSMSRTKREIVALAEEHGLICGAVNTMADVSEDRHFNERGVFVDIAHPVMGTVRSVSRPFVMHKSPWRLRRPAPLLAQHNDEVLGGSTGASPTPTRDASGSDASELPLSGIRVLDLSVVIAGPIATAKLGDMGAEVIRVESIQELGTGGRVPVAKTTKADIEGHPAQRRTFPNGDPGPRPWNRCAMFNSHARNKLSMTVDLRRPEGLEVLARLVRKSDVLIENHATDFVERRGFTYEWLREQNPNIIMVRMPGFGLDGPYAYWRTFGSTAEGHAGRSIKFGYSDLAPSEIPWVYPADPTAGAVAAFATIMALHHRNRTGEGQVIDLALAENILHLLGPSFLDFSMNGRVTGSLGNRHPESAPHGCYRASGDDRWVTIAVTTEEEWAGFRDALGNPEWATAERFATTTGRLANQDEFDSHIEAWTRGLDRFEMTRRLQEHGVPAGPVMTEADCYDDPHLQSRGYFERVTHAETGTHNYPGMFFKFSETPLGIRKPAPLLGEHNEYVYKELLEYTDAEYAELERTGHIGMDFAEHVP